MWLYQPVKFIFLLGAVLTCCKIAGYSGVFDPWQQVISSAEEIYNGGKSANSDSSVAIQPASQLNNQLANNPASQLQPQIPTVAVSNGVSDTPALDALLNELDAKNGEI